jgi:hypothetical protein
MTLMIDMTKYMPPNEELDEEWRKMAIHLKSLKLTPFGVLRRLYREPSSAIYKLSKKTSDICTWHGVDSMFKEMFGENYSCDRDGTFSVGEYDGPKKITEKIDE